MILVGLLGYLTVAPLQPPHIYEKHELVKIEKKVEPGTLNDVYS